jgi:hypothetical protein
MRKSHAHDGTEAVEPVHLKMFWLRIVRIKAAKCRRRRSLGEAIHSAIESCTGEAWSFAQDFDGESRTGFSLSGFDLVVARAQNQTG